MTPPTEVRVHDRCERIRRCLADVGLDPTRMMCSDHNNCVVGFGTGTEGRPLDEVERLCDRAIELSKMDRA